MILRNTNLKVIISSFILLNYINAQALDINSDKCFSKKGTYLQVLGSGGPELQDNRASSSYLIWVDGKAKVLVDAGTGSANNFGKSGAQMSDLELMLFSHYHTDHSADFAGYIKSAFFEGKTNNLAVYGPTGNRSFPDTANFLEKYIGEKGVYPYLSRYLGNDASYKLIPKSIKPSNKIEKIKYANYKISAIDAEHGPVPSLSWSITINNKKVTFSGDNGGHSDNLARLAKSSDLLVIHNAVPNHTTGFVRNLHMTPDRIGEIAKNSKAKKILLSHFMQRTTKVIPQTVNIIKSNYKGKVLIAKDLACYKI